MFNELEMYTKNILKWMKRNAYVFTSNEGYIESKLGWIGIANYINQTTGKDDYGDTILVLKDKRTFKISTDSVEKHFYPPELIDDRLNYYKKSFDFIYSQRGSFLDKDDYDIIYLMDKMYQYKLLPITHKDLIGGEDKMENANMRMGLVHCDCCKFGQLWGISYKTESDKEVLSVLLLHTDKNETYSIGLTPYEDENIDEVLTFYRKTLDDIFDQYGPLDMNDKKMVKFMKNVYGITLTEYTVDKLEAYVKPKTGIILCHGFDEEADRNMIAMERPNESYVSTRYMLNGKYVLRKYEDIERLMDVADKLYIDSSTYKFEEQLLFDQMRRIIDIATKKNVPLMFSKYIEREHRFIVNLHFEETLKNVTGCRTYQIEQVYITPPQTNDNTKSCTIRIRHMKDLANGYEKYVMTNKSQKLKTGSRIETEKDITKETYDILKNWKLPGSRIIKKTRTEISCSVNSCRVIVSIDRYVDPEVNTLAGFGDKYGICEVETDVIIPDSVLSSVPHITSWIHDAKEKDFLANITDIGCYSNKSLATLSPDDKIGYPNKPGAEVVTLSEITERMIEEGYRI